MRLWLFALIHYVILSPSARTTHCASRVWWKTMGDWCTRSIHTSVVLLGGVWEMPSPFERCWGVESCSWDAMGKLRNFQTPAFTRITSSLTPFFFSPSHIKRSWGEVCLLVRPVDGLHWAFGCPKTWSPSLFFSCTCELKINLMTSSLPS